MNNWNSGAYDKTNRAYCFWGGGHNGYPGNEMYCLRFGPRLRAVAGGNWTGVPDMVRINDPYQPSQGGCPANPATESLTLAPPPPGGPGLSANTRHTYNAFLYMKHLSQFWVFGGVLYCPIGQGNAIGGQDSRPWLYNAATNVWTHPILAVGSATIPTVTQGATSGIQYACYDSVGQQVWMTSPDNYLFSYRQNSDGTGTWTQYTNPGLLLGPMLSAAACDPDDRLMLVVGSGDTTAPNFRTFDLTNGNAVDRTVTGCNAWGGSYHPGVAYDPVAKQFVGVAGDAGAATFQTLYVLDPKTFRCWTERWGAVTGASDGSGYPQRDTSGVSPCAGLGCTFNRFGYVDDEDAFILCQETAQNCWQLRRRNPLRGTMNFGDLSYNSRSSSPGVFHSNGMDSTASVSPFMLADCLGLLNKWSIDTTTFTDNYLGTSGNPYGGGALRFTVPANVNCSNSSGSYAFLRPTFLTTGSVFYLTWRWRGDNVLTGRFSPGWVQGFSPKIMILLGGQTCGTLEATVQVLFQRGFPQDYSDCGARVFQTGNISIGISSSRTSNIVTLTTISAASISTITRTSGFVTVTTATAHPFGADLRVNGAIFGLTGACADFNGEAFDISSLSATQFEYTQLGGLPDRTCTAQGSVSFALDGRVGAPVAVSLTGVADGKFYVCGPPTTGCITPTPTQLTYASTGANASGTGSVNTQLLEQGDYNCLKYNEVLADCFSIDNMPANEWLTFYLKATLGTFRSTFQTTPDSKLEVWVARDGQPLKKFIDIQNFGFHADLNIPISAVSRASNVVTVTTSSPHGFSTGDLVFVDQTVDTSFWSTTNVPITVTSSTTFTLSQVGANASSTGGTAARGFFNFIQATDYSTVTTPETNPQGNLWYEELIWSTLPIWPPQGTPPP